MNSFEDLDVWKESVQLSADIYLRLRDLRDYGFRDQITRSGLSIPSNIAEGCERDSLKDRRNFFFYAKGSCGELQTQIQVGLKAGFIEESTATEWLGQARKFSAMLHSLITHLNQRIENERRSK